MTPKVRAKVRDRDRGVCRGCGREGLHLHHIKFRSRGGEDEPGNLVTLCVECHGSAHNLGKDSIQPWEFRIVIAGLAHTVNGLRVKGGGKVCVGCDFYTVDGECMLWGWDVGELDTCEFFTRRNRRFGVTDA